MSLVSHFSTFVLLVAIVSTSVHVNALKPSEALVLVQDSQQYDHYGLFSTNFVGITLDERRWGYVYFQCGDQADASYVLTMDTKDQTVPFFMSEFVYTFGSTGTWWIYLSMYGTVANFDWLQVRVVAYGHQGPITPLFEYPPRAWQWGYPPRGTPSPMISGPDTETSAPAPADGDGTAVALPSPTLITMPPRRQSSTSSIAVWLAPLLVGIIMIAITIPIAIVSYKKGQNNAKTAQVEVQAQDQQQQQKQETNQVEVACV